MGSNQSVADTTSLPSIYCEYREKCPARNRSAICVPCLYKNKTGSLKPQLVKVNADGSFRIQNRPGGHVTNCSCASEKLCDTCRTVMKNFVFPPSTGEERLSLLKPYEPHSNYAKF